MVFYVFLCLTGGSYQSTRSYTSALREHIFHHFCILYTCGNPNHTALSYSKTLHPLAFCHNVCNEVPLISHIYFCHLFLNRILLLGNHMRSCIHFLYSVWVGKCWKYRASTYKICLRFFVFSNLTVGTTLPYNLAIQHILRYFCIFPYWGGSF